MNDYSEKEIRSLLDSRLKEIPIYIYDTIPSTNTKAKEMILNEDCCSALLIADTQTAGRGRTGHSFFSPQSSGIYMSLIYKPDSFENASRATTKAAVAVSKAIEELYNIVPQVKWVNDIYLDGKKICGILTEAVIKPETSDGALVIGIGINHSASDLPEDIKNIAGFLPKKENISRTKLVAAVLNNLLPEIENLSDTTYLDYFRSHSLLTGKRIFYHENGERRGGIVTGIDEEAGLMVQTDDNQTIVIRNGEIEWR